VVIVKREAGLSSTLTFELNHQGLGPLDSSLFEMMPEMWWGMQQGGMMPNGGGMPMPGYGM
jgi:hypothetical protein